MNKIFVILIKSIQNYLSTINTNSIAWQKITSRHRSISKKLNYRLKPVISLGPGLYWIGWIVQGYNNYTEYRFV